MLSAEVGELDDVRFIDRGRALAMIEAHRDLIRGVKVRLSRELVGAKRAHRASAPRSRPEAAGLSDHGPPGRHADPLDDILRELRRGDVLTHCLPRPRAGRSRRPRGA